MYEDSTVGVVVPVYNEEEFVGRVIETVPTFVDWTYVVDDYSTDDTWAEIERHAALVNGNADADGAIPDAPVSGGAVTDGGATFSRRVVPIRHERNRGVGGAIVTGYRRARAEGIGVTAVMAGDGQMDPDRLARLIDPIVDGSADYAKGSRLLARDYSAAMSSWRLFGNRLLAVLTKVASGYWRTTDPQNGYTAISHRALSTLELSALYEDYGFLNDLLIRLNAHGMRVADVAMPAVYGDERSTITYSQFALGLSAVLLRGFLMAAEDQVRRPRVPPARGPVRARGARGRWREPERGSVAALDRRLGLEGPSNWHRDAHHVRHLCVVSPGANIRCRGKQGPRNTAIPVTRRSPAGSDRCWNRSDRVSIPLDDEHASEDLRPQVEA